MTVKELQKALDDKGVEYDESAKKADLEALLEASGGAKEAPEEVEESEEEVEATINEPQGNYKLVATFKAKNVEEGIWERLEYKSEGKTIQDLLNNVDFPKGINCLVTIKVKNGSKEIEKAVAPHKARQILEQKSAYQFNRVFRGL